MPTRNRIVQNDNAKGTSTRELFKILGGVSSEESPLDYNVNNMIPCSAGNKQKKNTIGQKFRERSIISYYF